MLACVSLMLNDAIALFRCQSHSITQACKRPSVSNAIRCSCTIEENESIKREGGLSKTEKRTDCEKPLGILIIKLVFLLSRPPSCWCATATLYERNVDMELKCLFFGTLIDVGHSQSQGIAKDVAGKDEKRTLWITDIGKYCHW